MLKEITIGYIIMFTQLHIMPDSRYSRTELNGICFTFKCLVKKLKKLKHTKQ